MFLTHYRIVKVVQIRPSEAMPHPYVTANWRQPSGEATVFT